MRLLRPGTLMVAVWTATVLLFYLLPVSYIHAPGPVAWSIIWGGVALFYVGALIGGRAKPRSSQAANDFSPDQLIVLCAGIGFVGIAAILIDKLYLSGIDWSIGLTAVRERRAVEVVENVEMHRSWLLYFGYATFSFSCAATTLFILAGERLKLLASICGQASVLPMMIYAVLYGGRMPILLVILLVVGASLTRAIQGKSLVPARRWLWWKLLILVVGLFLYTNQVWENRRSINNIVSYDDFVAVAASRWEMKPAPWLDRAIRNGEVPVARAMDSMSMGLYLTHSPTIVQRMVEHWREFSVYGGLYQIGILSPLADVLIPSFKLSQNMRSELISTGIYGWFPSAWGAWIGDAGPIGAAICVFIWGALSGYSYRITLERHCLGSQLMLSFAYLTIFISPLNGPFGLANSFLIFLSFAMVCAWISYRASATAQQPTASGLSM